MAIVRLAQENVIHAISAKTLMKAVANAADTIARRPSLTGVADVVGVGDVPVVILLTVSRVIALTAAASKDPATLTHPLSRTFSIVRASADASSRARVGSRPR